MVVHIINVECVRVGKAQNQPASLREPSQPKNLQLALERMQPETGQIHIGHGAGRVGSCENIALLDGVLGRHAAPRGLRRAAAGI